MHYERWRRHGDPLTVLPARVPPIPAGTRFARVVIIEVADTRKGHRRYRCLCDCGTEFVTAGGNLQQGHTRSCGCLHDEVRGEIARRHQKHGFLGLAHQARLASLISDARTEGCARCGETDPACLDFHHRDPAEKSFGIRPRGGAGHSLDAVKAEIAKCVVLCANCHRRLHAGQFSL